MDDFLSSVHSEVNEDFVSNPYPHLREQVRISLRVRKSAVNFKIYLRILFDGSPKTIRMQKAKQTSGYEYYECYLIMQQKKVHYHFIIVTEDHIYYYNRLEITTHAPTEDYDFVLIAGFDNPSWVNERVFYQIFPDRFNNGNENITPRESEYSFHGHRTTRLAWHEKPLEYNEGHCLDFYGGDLEGIGKKISYLKELGVGAIYINPIFQARTNHKYDCVDYFNVDDYLGGNKALGELVKKLHEEGMRIIVDVSINHTGSEHVWFTKALADKEAPEREYYYIQKNNKYTGWHGIDTLPQLNYSSSKLREKIIYDDDSLVRHYLKPGYDIDGWRFDVGNNTGRKGEHQFSNGIFRGVRDAVKSVKKEAYIIGEHWKDNISYLQGDQWDGAMNYFASCRPLRCFAGEVDRYVGHLVDDPKKYNNKTGADLEKQIFQHYSRLPNQVAFLQFNLLDSHDIHRFHSNTDVFDFDIYRGMLIIFYLLPGTFSIYYGDEVGLEGWKHSVEGCRFPMQWDSSKWDRRFYELYSGLNRIKQKEKALHTGSYRALYADETTFVLARFSRKRVVIGIISKNSSEKTIEIPLEVTGICTNTEFKDLLSGECFLSNTDRLSIPLGVKGSFILAADVRE